MAGLRYLTCRSNTVNENVSPVTASLREAIQKGSVSRVRHVLQDPDVNLDELEQTGMTPLGLAANLGHQEIVQLLIKHGASVNKPDFYGLTGLQYAAEFNHIALMRCLIDEGANVDWMDEHDDGLSALHIVACKGQVEAAKVLLDAGANVNAKDFNNVTVLHCAVANGNENIAKALISGGACVNAVGSTTRRTPLFLAIDVDDVDMVDLLLANRAKTSLQDKFGLTPLCVACLHNKEEIAVRIVRAGAKVNLQDRDQNIALHYTARNGNVPLTKLLLDAGSQLSVINKHFESPLHNAVRMGRIEVIRELVSRGCDVNICHSAGNVTPLHLAVGTQNEAEDFAPILELLIEGGCDLDSRAYMSLETPLYRALAQNKVPIALLLLQHGASPNVDCPYDVTVLHKCCQRDLYEVIDVLLHTDIDWSRERWLHVDKSTCGINPVLLGDYEDNVPLSLHGKLDLLVAIETMRGNPVSLMRLCRRVLRNRLGRGIHRKLKQLNLPTRLVDFIMLRII